MLHKASYGGHAHQQALRRESEGAEVKVTLTYKVELEASLGYMRYFFKNKTK